MRLKPWQKDVLNKIERAFNRGHKAILIQLPTGAGKTLVALRTFRKLNKKNRGLRLVVALPSDSKQLRDVWEAEMKKELGAPVAELNFITHRDLSRACTGVHAGRLWRHYFDKERTLVVVDEIHRAKRFKEAISSRFWNGEIDNGQGRPPWGPR